MTARALRCENPADKKMPDVFERLSKQQTNKVNSQQTLRSLGRDLKGDLKSMPSSIKKRNPPKAKNSAGPQKVRIKSNALSSEHSKEDFLSSDSYHDKALLERVPETVGKDVAESASSGPKEVTQNTINSLGDVRTEDSPLKTDSLKSRKSNRLLPLSLLVTLKSSNHPRESNEDAREVFASCKPKHSINDKMADRKSNASEVCLNSSLKGKNSDEPTSSKSLIKRSVPLAVLGPNSSTTTTAESKHQAPLKMKLEDSLSSTKIEDEDKYHKETNGGPSNTTKKVIDNDKDICETDKESEDGDFYKVKVQTRLVSYENSTLVIRNTSKQGDSYSSLCTDSQAVVENSSLNESFSSLSLQNSLSDQEFSSPVVSEDTASLPDGEGELTRLKGVRTKLGQLVTRGRSILSDVRTYSTSYVPDVRTLSNRFQGVSRRSFRSMASLPKDFLASPAPPVTPVSPILRGECVPEKERKSEMDSGFSSLISTPDQTASGNAEKSVSKSVAVSDPLRRMDAGAVSSCPLRKGNGDVHEHPTTESGSSSGGTEDAIDFIKFFSSCSCQSARVSSLQENEGQGSTQEVCTCQIDTGLPLEIKEILDVDHARMWWTITGNFGNILPIDWSKTYTRQKYLPVLNLNEAKKRTDGSSGSDSVTPSPREDEDEEVAQDLDLHQLILAGTQQEHEPVKSAEEVIKEIDDIMQEGSSSEDEGIDASSLDSKDSSKMELQQLPPPLYHDKLKDLSVNELNEALMELEVVIRRYSETLIAQLAHRDELEYEKELKNTFISLLLQVQNKRRNFNVEKKKVKKPLGPNGVDPKYLTTVIPYDVGHGPPDNETIQILIKTINEDSPTVPTLLTDYILKVLCPS